MLNSKVGGSAYGPREGLDIVALADLSHCRNGGGRRTWSNGKAASLIVLTCLFAARPAQADEQTVKLIQLLIQKGILSSNQARDLLRETGAPAGKTRHATATIEEAPPVPGAQIRVTYVPQFIRRQIADEVRAQVMDQAQTEGWAAPDALPEWTKRFKLFGDIRVRAEDDLFDRNNYNQFVNFNGINNGSAFDANSYVNGAGQANPPFLNTTEDRQRFRLRARFGLDAYIDDWVSAVIRVGTGQDDGPVSPNQTLGTGNGTLGASGDFAKPALWLDRGYFEMKPLAQVTLYAGREGNPFLPSDLMFYPELGFDGVAASGRQSFGPVTLFGTAGAFPLFNTAFDFSTNSNVKYASNNAYLAALQAGATWQVRPNLLGILGVGIFDYLNVQGAVSSPCVEQAAAQFYCSSDDTRTPFEQFGNTLYAIRNIVPTTGTPSTSPDPQYYGLASRFNVLDIHPRVDVTTYHPIDVSVEGEFIKNLAYDQGAILTHGPAGGPIGPQNNIGSNGHYQGGDTGYMVKATVGELEMHKLWDWNVSLSYRYLQTDATLDAIADADFHQGGTNAQGYILGINLGIAHNTWLNFRYMSADAISGPHYGTDQIFLDVNSSF